MFALKMREFGSMAKPEFCHLIGELRVTFFKYPSVKFSIFF